MDTTHSGLDAALDVLGQQPLLQIYTQLTLCFVVPHDCQKEHVVQKLQDGLTRASASFPWIAGQVVNEGSSPGNTGIFRIRPLDSAPGLVVRDLGDDDSAPTMQDLINANFPMAMLDEDLLASRKTLPGSIDGPREVLSVQAVFIRDGLLLTFTAAHSTMDLVGQAQIIETIRKACRGEEYTGEELRIGNLARDNLIPLLDESYEPGPELQDQVSGLNESAHASHSPKSDPPPRCTWVYFSFSQESLHELKDLANSTLPPDSAVAFVSTDDALSAFVWQSVARVRLPRLLPDPAGGPLEVKLTRAVDVRSHLGLPATYPGLMQNITYHKHDLRALAEAPLGAVAADLRLSLLPGLKPNDGGGGTATDIPSWDLARRTRALVTVAARSTDKTGISFTGTVDLGADLMLSSWAKVGPALYGLDFGIGLGPPVAVRRPRFDPFESLAYFMPRAPDGGVALAISLREEDLARLREDLVFSRHASYVG